LGKPNFFIVGQTKSGTTSLKQYLSQHPDIFIIHEGKGFFGFEPPEITEEEYFLLFKNAKDEKRIGEKCTDYLSSTNTALKLKNKFPDAKIIMILRNPIDMMYALHSSQLYTETMENIKDFGEAIKAEKWRKEENKKTPGKWHPHMFYTDIGKYTPQVRKYIDQFGKKNVKVIILDDMKKDMKKIFKEVLDFLEIDSSFIPQFKIFNEHREYRSRTLQAAMKDNKLKLSTILGKIPYTSSIYRMINQPQKKKIPMDPILRKELQVMFFPEIEELGKLIDRDLMFWCEN
jgi:hypothetical protein